jgi:hypothetical protein
VSLHSGTTADSVPIIKLCHAAQCTQSLQNFARNILVTETATAAYAVAGPVVPCAMATPIITPSLRLLPWRRPVVVDTPSSTCSTNQISATCRADLTTCYCTTLPNNVHRIHQQQRPQGDWHQAGPSTDLLHWLRAQPSERATETACWPDPEARHEAPRDQEAYNESCITPTWAGCTAVDWRVSGWAAGAAAACCCH